MALTEVVCHKICFCVALLGSFQEKGFSWKLRRRKISRVFLETSKKKNLFVIISRTTKELRAHNRSLITKKWLWNHALRLSVLLFRQSDLNWVENRTWAGLSLAWFEYRPSRRRKNQTFALQVFRILTWLIGKWHSKKLCATKFVFVWHKVFLPH